MNYDLSKLTETQLLEIFNAIIGQPGPVSAEDLAEIVLLNSEIERRTVKKERAFEEAVFLEANEIDARTFRAGGRA